jgi:hypothetical protein
MKAILLIALVLIANLSFAQTGNAEADRFISLFKSQLAKLDVGKIEEHYDQGYFKALSESDYFDKDVEVGITTIYQKCSGKDESAATQEINSYFEQLKRLKAERKEIMSKMNDFNFIKPYLKIRIYSDDLMAQYNSWGIVKNAYKGFIEVIVLDLPSGIGSLEKKYLNIWNKPENEVYLVAKENTLNKLNQKFEKAQVGKNGEEFYLLASDADLFITSSILDLKKASLPAGKYGTLIAVPNNTVIVALPLNDKLKIDQFCLNFMGLASYLYESKETKPISDNLFWINGNEMFAIEKDLKNEKFIYPAGLQKFVDK